MFVCFFLCIFLKAFEYIFKNKKKSQEKKQQTAMSAEENINYNKFKSCQKFYLTFFHF